ncbi:MAG: T9SS type A sorting domain-containing protein [Bacteroidetes bacterium]|nr:T9SS type A sorting domain-containing protein [Bacteroidota bacterium]
MKRKVSLLIAGIIFSPFIFAQSLQDVFYQTCRPAVSHVDLDINNVRATLLNEGDLWWGLSSAGYEIPKGSNKYSMFAGALWFGALDGGGSLMTAAMTYRQTGDDFWPGPLDTNSVSTTDSICHRYDRFWKLNRSDVESFLAHRTDPNYTIPEAILSWPGNGNAAEGQAHYLAPFFDADGDGIYNPHNGDYPRFALNGNPDCNTDLLGDQAVWWIFNDKGNTHSETGGNPFGMEVQAMAFSFRSNDALNDATFYRYKIINRSSTSWNQMWMGQFADAEVGGYDDDYVGCDVGRGMGYGYNGDAFDQIYGWHPPAIGIDFVQGPLADANDHIDNDRDSLVDEPGERIEMSMFKYYDNDFSIVGNPETGLQYYYFMQGLWKDGSPQTYGGNGAGGTTPCSFMFPDNTDPYGWGTNGIPEPAWSEVTVGNTPFDRRFLESAGPFSMQPGQVQTVTIAVPWARDTAGNNIDAITKLQQADDRVQQLFDNCFSNISCSENAAPEFSYTVNGGNVYFTSESATGIYQWNFGDDGFASQQFPAHTYTSAGTYHVCFTVITSCATQTVCNDVVISLPQNECGPQIQRIEGQGSGTQVLDLTDETVNEILDSSSHRSLFPKYKELHGPVKITYEDYDHLTDGDYRIAFDTTDMNAHWKLWKAGGTDTVYSDSTIGSGNKQIISQWGIGVQTQQVNLPGLSRNPDHNGYLEATLKFADENKNWLSGISDNDDYTSFNWIRSGDFRNTNPGSGACASAFDDRFIGSSPIDPNEDYESSINGTWAPYRLCADGVRTNANTICYSTGVVYPDVPTTVNNKFDNIPNVNIVFTADQTKWSRCIVFESGTNPSTNEGGTEGFFMRAHASVDKSGRTVAQGGISDVNDPEAADYIGANGMGWFPGYAINVETGERLNIAFAENSSLGLDNGADMLFDPDEKIKTNLGEPLFGGMHYVYVFNHNGNAVYTSGVLTGELKDVPLYDAGKMMYTILSSSVASTERTEIFRDAAWAGIPLLNAGHQLLECDATVRLRVEKPYSKYQTDSIPQNNNEPLYGFSIDKMHLSCNMYDGNVIAFPNPFWENCTILFDNTENESSELDLYDMRGRIVKKYSGITTDRIDVTSDGLEQGVYMYTLSVGGRKPQVGKIILK